MPLDQKANLVVWKIQYCAPPTVLRHCKKCGKKSEYVCSGEFRVNAQQKTLDVWLIYKCAHCNTTWNSTIYSRVSPHKLDGALLERFHSNDKALVMRYAMDLPLLQRNGAEVKLPDYRIVGEEVSLKRAVTIKIQSQYLLPLRVSCVLRKKLGITQREFNDRLSRRQIQSSTGQDLRKCKLSVLETLVTIFDQ